MPSKHTSRAPRFRQPSRLPSRILLAAILPLTASCGSEEPPAGPDGSTAAAGPVAAVELTTDRVELRPGESMALSAKPVDEAGRPISGVQVSWSSSDPSIASLSTDGTLSAHKPGEITVTASAGEASAALTVMVLAPVAALSVEPSTLDLRRGRLTQFRARLTDDQGTVLHGRAVNWSTSEPLVARVNSDGVVEGIADGQVSIRAESEGVAGSAIVRVQSAGFLSVTAGMGHTCALALDGTAWCWGSNDHGQLGTGDYTPSSTPQAVSGARTFSSIAAGAGYTCAVTPTGEGYCWGDNSMMELGNRQAGKTSTVPVQIQAAPAFASIGGASDMSHTCALTTGRTAYCWGYNRFGMVGNGSVRDEPYPLPVVGGLAFKVLSAAHMRTCAIAADGRAHCWGRGGRTQLGNPSASVDTCDGFPCSMSPRVVSGNQRYASISTGRMHTCAVSESGRLFCWGENALGQVGDGSQANAGTPRAIEPGRRFSRVSAGAEHTCAVADDGQSLCWGANPDGRLGDGSRMSSPLPVPVRGQMRFVAVTAGYTHSCGLGTDGAVLCWGDNMMGQLGDGSTQARLGPVAVREP